MLKRREARQQAFEFIFERAFGETDVDSLIGNAKAARDIEISDYARKVTAGVFEHLEEIDGYIEKYSRGRSLRRLSKVVLTALRLAVYEILYVDDLDATVSINEAIELAKKFAGKDEAGYVNGVLGGFMKAIEAGEIKPASAQAADETAANEGDGK